METKDRTNPQVRPEIKKSRITPHLDAVLLFMLLALLVTWSWS